MYGSQPRPERDPIARRFIRRVLGLAVYAAILALLLLGGGGWFYSSQIRSDALVVADEGPAEYEFVVSAADSETVTLLLPAEADDDLVSSEILGIEWVSGYGQVSDVLELTPTEVIRAYHHIAGSSLEAGEKVRLEGYAYPSDPRQAHGFDFETVNYSSSLGDFEAWLVDGSDSTWAIFVHGRGAHRREALRVLPVFVAADIPSLMITYRNDEGAPATKGRLARFGLTEWVDVEGAVRYALDNGADDVILVGFSMGGAAVVSVAYRSELADQVRGMILDAPALKLGAMVDARAADTDLPLIGLPVPVPLTTTAKAIAALRFDLDWSQLDHLARAALLDMPILLIHGTEDDSVPIWLSDSLAQARPELVSYEVFPDAGHVRSWNVDPDRYESVVASFLERLG